MPLQTAEAPTVTADLGLGDIQLESLPVFNPTDGARTQVISTLDIAEEAKKAGSELCHEHISGLKGEHILEHAMSMERDLIKVAINAFSLAAIQIYALQIPLNARPENLVGFFDSPACAIFYFYSISGVVLDVQVAMFALISFLALRKTITTAHKARGSVCGSIWSSPESSQLPGYCSPAKGCTIPLGFPDDLRRLVHIMDHYSDDGFGMVILFTAGIVFYLISICTLLITALPVAMGVSLAMVIIAMHIWCLVGVIRYMHWKKFLSFLVGSFRIWLDAFKKPVIHGESVY